MTKTEELENTYNLAERLYCITTVFYKMSHHIINFNLSYVIVFIFLLILVLLVLLILFIHALFNNVEKFDDHVLDGKQELISCVVNHDRVEAVLGYFVFTEE